MTAIARNSPLEKGDAEGVGVVLRGQKIKAKTKRSFETRCTQNRVRQICKTTPWRLCRRPL